MEELGPEARSSGEAEGGTTSPLGFVAWQANNPASKKSTVADISSSGFICTLKNAGPLAR